MLVLSLSVLTACNKNKHEFSSKWKFDETNHWHECTTKQHTDTTEKTPHVFTWTEKTPANADEFSKFWIFSVGMLDVFG